MFPLIQLIQACLSITSSHSICVKHIGKVSSQVLVQTDILYDVPGLAGVQEIHTG